MRRVILSTSFFFFSPSLSFSMCFPAETRHNGLPVCSLHVVLRLLFSPHSLFHSRRREAQLNPSAAGLATVRQMRNRRRCHVSSVYPAARVFSFGSTCM